LGKITLKRTRPANWGLGPPALIKSDSCTGWPPTANAAWLVLAVMAFNLTRAAGTLTGTALAKATTATIRRKLVHVPARIASSARRLSLHLSTGWPWEDAWTTLFTGMCAPPPAVTTT